ncbi:hypothetical protein Q8F55_005564 [Vanrija albida]|uniref:RING-type domain-containing protein n=1 Tax=Vanrija albida TaxID=181172 RepID=A0ABR3Q2S6_9TREE
MTYSHTKSDYNTYSIVIAVHPEQEQLEHNDWRLGEIEVDWIDFTREKSTNKDWEEERGMVDKPRPAAQGSRSVPGSRARSSLDAGGSNLVRIKPRKRNTPEPPETPDSLSRQPLLAHIPGPIPVDTTTATGVSLFGRGVVHLFKHEPPPSLIARLEGQNGESSRSGTAEGDYAGEHAEGEDGSLVAILAVPAWMRPADLLEFLGGWATCLEGVRMIREATTPNRSIAILKFRDPLQASDFMIIFTGKAFSTLDTRETCHPIRIHHLVLHKLEGAEPKDVAIPAFPPSVYASRARALPDLLKGVSKTGMYELPSCPVCLERLDSTVTGLVTLPCAHTFDCDCLRKWGDSRCPVCRVSHLLLSSAQDKKRQLERDRGEDITRFTQCGMCDSTENIWICVVCGAVGCGRYSKGHARRHWEESGHVLAMEVETQRVWDYEGDNYVHRLIQTRTDGKLVELPSASSLAAHAATHRRPMPLNRSLENVSGYSHSAPESMAGSAPSTPARANRGSYSQAHERRDSEVNDGPSSNDAEKMSTIESITLEYSYLLSSQLEAMRQHYEQEAASQAVVIAKLEAAAARTKEAEDAAAVAEARRVEADKAREKAERRAEKALDLSRSLQTSLGSEKAMSEGLNSRVQKLRDDLTTVRAARDAKAAEVDSLNETVRDLMFTLEAGLKIQEAGGTDGGEGGDLVVVNKKKGKKK